MREMINIVLFEKKQQVTKNKTQQSITCLSTDACLTSDPGVPS